MSRCVKTGARWVNWQGDRLARPCDLFYHGDGDFELRGIPADNGGFCKGQPMDEPDVYVDGVEFTHRASGEYIDGRVNVIQMQFSDQLIDFWRKWDPELFIELIEQGVISDE